MRGKEHTRLKHEGKRRLKKKEKNSKIFRSSLERQETDGG